MPKYSIPVVITTKGHIIFEANDPVAAKYLAKEHWATFKQHYDTSDELFDIELLSEIEQDVDAKLGQMKEVDEPAK